MAKQKVTQVFTRDGMFASGWGDLGKRLPHPSKTIKGLEMTVSPGNGIQVTCPGKVSFLIPFTNVILAELGEISGE